MNEDDHDGSSTRLISRKQALYTTPNQTDAPSYNGPYGFGDKEDDNEDLKDLPEEDRQIWEYYNHENRIDPRTYVGLFLVIFPVFIHTMMFVSEAPNGPSVLIRLVYLGFALSLTWIIKLFFQYTNEDSISGMVAQRHMKIAYFALLGIITLSAFTSGLFSIYAIRSNTLENDNHLKVLSYILGFLSPLMSACILLAPLPLYKTQRELGMRIIRKKRRPLSKIENGKKVPVYDTNTREILQFYSLRLWEVTSCCCCSCRCGLKLQLILHYVFVLSGVGMGYIATAIQLYFKRNQREYHYGFCILYLIGSAIGMVLFMFQGSEEDRRALKRRAPNRDAKSYLLQVSLLKEFVGLFYYLSALITVLVMNRNLIDH